MPAQVTFRDDEERRRADEAISQLRSIQDYANRQAEADALKAPVSPQNPEDAVQYLEEGESPSDRPTARSVTTFGDEPSPAGGEPYVQQLTRADEAVSNINPAHYRSDPSGVECIDVVRHRNFNVGNAIKYLWRAGLKAHPGQEQRDKEIEDLKKARWYIADEIRKLGGDPEA